MSEQPRVLNPLAIGNPDMTPIVQLPQGIAEKRDVAAAIVGEIHDYWCHALEQGCKGPSRHSDCQTSANRIARLIDREADRG